MLSYFFRNSISIWSLLLCGWLLCPTPTFSQSLNTSFTDQSTLLPVNGKSGAPVGIVDMNGDKKDDIVLIDDRNKLVIMTQNAANAAFSLYQNTSLGSSMWSVCVADYNHDGRNDVLTGGAFNNIRLYEGNPTTETLSGSILANSNIFLQGSNFADIDNDGWADIFACHDVGDSRKYKNDGTGVFSFDNSMLNTQAPPSDHSGNYASIWIDYDNDGDLDMYLSKCRQGVSSSSDQRRINRLFQNDGSGNYTEVAAAAGLQIGAQTWGTDFADIDNDGDLDAFVNNHGDDCQLMRNNGNGTFTDVTSGSGLLPTLAGSGSLLGIQAIFRDFDNDGYVDLLFSGSDHYLFYNDGDGTFTLASNPSNPFGSTNIHTFAIGDLNKDGFLDVYAGHGSGFNSLGSATDDLFMNDGNSNHFIAIDLVGTQSNINGIGARLEFYGDWGKQIREVRSGEGYGIMNTFTQHVGLGTYTTLDSLVIRWPSGLVNKYYNLATDQFHCLTEHNNMINASFTVDKNQVFPPPITINFDASESFNPGSGAIAYAWDFGDGNAGTGVSPSHTYTTADSFLVILTVSENVDNTDDKDSLWIVIGNSIDDFPGLDLDADNDGIPDSVETAVGGFTYVIPTLNININGAATTRYVNLSSQNVSIGDQVKLSDFEANGDLNGTNEYLDLNINDGQFVQNSNSTGSQCQGLTAFLTPLTPTVTVIDIGPNIGSATPVPGLKVGTISGTGVGSPGSCGSQAELRFTVKRDAMLDVDGDGIPNYLDLDSDNDGVWDVVEAGGTDADHDAYIDDLANQASLANPTNSDGDSWPNYVDLESGNAANDGTGTFDMAATDFGYFDTNGDGQITAADTDGGTDNDQDGLDDLVDGDLKRKGSALIGEEVFVVGHTIARMWNEVLLAGIRGDFARPTVHARNLHHISAAMFDAWSAYEDEAHFYFLGNGIGGFNIPFSNLPVAADSLAAQKEALSYAAYRLIKHRFGNSPGKNRTIFLADLVMQDQGYSTAVTSTDYQNGGPAELGNYIADRIIAYGLQDNANETGSYENLYYTPDNNFLEIAQPGNPNMTNPNRWQPLAFDVFIDQSGNVISSTVPDFLSPEWGNVPPFAMTDAQKATFNRGGDNYKVYEDPGQPPLLDTIVNGGGTSDYYKWGFSMVATWSAHLDPADGIMWDISPKSIGNIAFSDLPDTWADYSGFYNYQDGGVIGNGRPLNPKTGLPYQAQMVPRGDYARVLAEFWADGPDSETPPGHWFTLLNYVSDHAEVVKKWRGQGETLSDLEWDIKTYFAMGGTMHDAAIAAWSVKGWYDYIRPVSALRYMARRGQSSDPGAASYDPGGIPLVPGRIELIAAGDALAGPGNINVGKIKIYGWKGPNFIVDPNEDVAGVGWILADEWWPYQRPSFVTPPFAGYVSGHSTYSRAAAELMTYMTGDEYFPGGMGEFYCKKNEFLVFENGPSQDITLQWATYRDASDECSLSRIWGGIHPPADDIPGRKMGRDIGVRAFTYADSIFDQSLPSVRIKAFLEGAYSNGGMNFDYSTSETLPLADPKGWGQTADAAVLDQEGMASPTDWIWVELRDASDSTVVVDSMVALIQADGQLVSHKGGDKVAFYNVPEGNYYVVLRHPNHLGVMTAAPVALNNSTPLIDFTDPGTAVYSKGGPALKNDNGVMVLWSGDANGDGTINAKDNVDFWRLENGQPFIYGTRKADFNLDGAVNSFDLNTFWLINNSKLQQLP